MVKKAVKGKKVVVGSDAAAASSGKSSLFKKNPRSFRIGAHIQPKRDLTRFVRWPKYVRIQRQKRILMQRLKVPPTINQFANTINANQAKSLFKLLAKYSPETRQEKNARLKKQAEAGGAGKTAKTVLLKFGLNHITNLIEQSKAKLVCIAHDVDPVELVVHLPTLCRKKEVPYCIVRGKANLGNLVHNRTATCVALTEVHKEDFQDLATLQESFKQQFNNDDKGRKTWGGGVMGIKNLHMMQKRERIREIELSKKANM